jgi:hypothetical protein
MDKFKVWATYDWFTEQQQTQWLRTDCGYDQVELALGEFKRTDDSDEYAVEHPDLGYLAVDLLCAPIQSTSCDLIGGLDVAPEKKASMTTTTLPTTNNH